MKLLPSEAVVALMERCPGCSKGLPMTNRGYHHDNTEVLDECLLVRHRIELVGFGKGKKVESKRSSLDMFI